MSVLKNIELINFRKKSYMFMSIDNNKQPKRIKIVPDDHHAEIVGKTKDLNQFFLTTPFTARHPETMKSCEYLALFIWEKDGTFKEAIIDNLGPREELDEEEYEKKLKNRIELLGKITITEIEIAPFEIEKFGLKFGLIYSSETFDGDDEPYETVILHPGNYMAFYPPWDGEYDT